MSHPGIEAHSGSGSVFDAFVVENSNRLARRHRPSLEHQSAAPDECETTDGSIDGIEAICLADVVAQRIDWLWRGFVAFGKVTVLEGDPGGGKSTLTLHLATCVSAGLALPDGSRHEASDVLMVSYEDDVADTIKPRAQAAGANVQRLRVLRGRAGGLFTLPEHVPALRGHIERTGARLVIIDPLGAAFSQETDSYKDAHVRRVLAPLAELGADMGVAIVVVRHLTKSTTGRAILSGGGSIGIAGAARFVIVVGPAPGDPSERIMASVKTNVSEAPGSLRFRLVRHAVSAPDGGDPIETSRVEWLGTSDVTGDELAAARDISAGEDRSTLEEARNWLEADLSNGARLVREVLRDGKAAGFTERTLQRASQQLKVVRHREGPKSPFTWSLPVASAGTFSPTIPVLASPANIQNRGEDAPLGENASAGAFSYTV